jgi:hypothetical protein
MVPNLAKVAHSILGMAGVIPPLYFASDLPAYYERIFKRQNPISYEKIVCEIIPL